MNKDDLKARMEDYSRFIVTLLILSVYFYLGTIITTYLTESNYELLMMGLTTISISAAFVYTMRWKKCSQKLQDQETQ
ncbi:MULTISPECIES: YrhC family protein [Pontibacillus]|uniref:YrhC family protein n=1 Tax=Pontibacillus chungwhensis TaxID=265426 RepID=A0ABY8UTP0_9BACI|nr:MULTISPECIES: YrhC family protein [Pontibacillus]MCD5323660.1 YrhC family protein [Pontibacillus sp. HN14]WIF97026.1 YrhC family protein [Pontibacillus chungwhensis]